MVKVKVCGITNVEDALKAVEFGADALGFNFYPPSPRCLSYDRAREILVEIPPRICRVAIFVNETREVVEKGLRDCRSEGHPGFSTVQFHGDESRDYCRGWGLKVIKAFRVRERESLTGINKFPADLYLLDSWFAGYGGSGSSFTWSWTEGLELDRLILSGGLNPGNVREAIHRVRPFAVDVCSGVEAGPGVKDHEKLKEFILAAKAS